MGNALVQSRVKGALACGIFAGSECGLSSWGSVVKLMAKMHGLRGATLEGNRLSKSIPASFMRLDVWASLTTLDLSSNGLKCACVLGRLGACIPLSTRRPREEFRGVTYPLESLNLSRNALRQLPPLLLEQFPKLARLLCRDNKVALDVHGGLARCIGASASLATVDLGCSRIRRIVLVDSGVDGSADAENKWGDANTPYPSLRELRLDGNDMAGTFTLVTGQRPDLPEFPLLRTIDIRSQGGQLERVDPLTYVVAPSLNAVELTGNAQQESIMAELRQTSEYKQWCKRHKSAVDRNLNSTAHATLM